MSAKYQLAQVTEYDNECSAHAGSEAVSILWFLAVGALLAWIFVPLPPPDDRP